MEYKDLDLFPLARNAWTCPDEREEAENVTISVRGGAAPVFADRQLMEELIYNLCDNAIRYNKKDGSVTVTTERDRTYLPLCKGYRDRDLAGASGADF